MSRTAVWCDGCGEEYIPKVPPEGLCPVCLEAANLKEENATLRARVADLEAQRQSDLIDGMGHKPIIDDLRASLNEASERVKALENACRNILSLQIRIAGGLTSAAAISEAILAAGEALSRPAPKTEPKCEECGVSAGYYEESGACINCGACPPPVKPWPQATPKPEWKKPTMTKMVCDCRNHENQVCDICTGVIFRDPKDLKDKTTKPQATTGEECANPWCSKSAPCVKCEKPEGRGEV